MKDVKEFTVIRKFWNGDKPDELARSALLNNGYKCCLGFFCGAAGFADEQILERGYPSDINPLDALTKRHPLFVKPEHSLSFTKDENIVNRITEVNDDKDMPVTEKIEKLTSLFAGLGIKVNFVDE